MKTPASRLLGAVVFAALVTSPAEGQAFWKKLFGRDLERAPNATEIRGQEQQATALMQEADAAAAAGRNGKAIDLYEKIVKRFPLTETAGNAQFQAAALYEAEGKISSAFDAYQSFIETYKQSPRFPDALQRQFDIASSAKDGAKVRWLGIKRRIETSRVVEMFETVIANAPRSSIAPRAQFLIGEAYAQDGNYAGAVRAYQRVVDEYPEAKEASDAQFAIGQISFDEVEGGTEDAGSIVAAREAMEDFLLVNPEAADLGEASEMLEQLDETSAAKSFSIGRFYEKQGNLKAAAIYYGDVLQVPGSTHYEDARARLADISAEDPEAVQKATDVELATNELVVPAEADVKNRADYLGPPAPPIRNLRKPRMRASSDAPVIPIEEPELPAIPGEGLEMTDPIDGRDLLLPDLPGTPEAEAPEEPEPSEELTTPPPPDTEPAPDIEAPPPPTPDDEDAGGDDASDGEEAGTSGSDDDEDPS